MVVVVVRQGEQRNSVVRTKRRMHARTTPVRRARLSRVSLQSWLLFPLAPCLRMGVSILRVQASLPRCSVMWKRRLSWKLRRQKQEQRDAEERKFTGAPLRFASVSVRHVPPRSFSQTWLVAASNETATRGLGWVCLST